MEQGWIKLSRNLLHWEWYDDINTARLFIHCLLKANHKNNNWKGILVKKGTFITSRDKLSIETGLTVQQVRTSLNRLKSTNEITIQSTKLNTCISIINWDKWQAINPPTNQQLTNDQPTVNPQLTTNNNDKKEKNENNIINRFKNNNHEALFMQLNIDPILMPKYLNEFTAKLTASASDIKTIKEVNQWWFNWLKLQPKKNLTYLTPDERLRKGLNPKRTYVWSTIDGSDYAGLLSDEEKKENGLDISQTVTLKLNTL